MTFDLPSTSESWLRIKEWSVIEGPHSGHLMHRPLAGLPTWRSWSQFLFDSQQAACDDRKLPKGCCQEPLPSSEPLGSKVTIVSRSSVSCCLLLNSRVANSDIQELRGKFKSYASYFGRVA